MAARQQRLAPTETALLVSIALSLAVSLLVAFISYRNDARWSLFHLENLVGQTARSVHDGRGLEVATDSMGTPGNVIVFHAARMPVPSYMAAWCAALFGEHGLRSAALLKSFLFLLPVWLAYALVFRVAHHSTQPPGAFAVLLLLPFCCLVFLANVTNLQVEEGYASSLLAGAFGVALLLPRGGARRLAQEVVQAGLLAVLLALLYLSKSAMLPAVLVLTAASLLRLRSLPVRVALVAAVVLTAGGWAAHQHAASGRYSLGTSLDGVNLHKGNNPAFRANYPPPAGLSLDHEDPALSEGKRFNSEWQFHDFHRAAALAFIRQYPGESAGNALRKAWVFFLSARHVGSAPLRGPADLVDTLGLVLFRLLLLGAIVAAALGALTGAGPGRYAGAVFLALTAACALPYVVGFAYTRHASVLILPSALLLCRALLSEDDLTAAG